MMNMDQKEIFNYLSPIVNSCAGYVKTNGFMVVIGDRLIMMSADRGSMVICNINPIPVIFVSSINKFLGCKNRDEGSTFLTDIYFIGNNLVYNELISAANQYETFVNSHTPIYEIDDMDTIEGFREGIDNKANDGITWINIGLPNNLKYRCPVFKPITPLSKSDKCGIHIYEDIYNIDNIKIIVQDIYKKKFKLTYKTYSRQFI